MSRNIILYIIVVVWSIFLLILELFGYNSDLELINVIIGTLFAGLISYDRLSNPNIKNIYVGIIGIIEIILGFILLSINFNLVNAGILLMIGGELIGISLATRLKKGSSMNLNSTRRPDTLDPEPSPDPSPF